MDSPPYFYFLVRGINAQMYNCTTAQLRDGAYKKIKARYQ